MSFSAVADAKNSESRHDSTLPIEVIADELEVKQNENKAIFSGNVDALQGNMVLRADSLIVYYHDKNDGTDQQGISRIDAAGNVFVSSPNETARGTNGVYNVDKKIIILIGEVILTQGDNVIQGERLEMDLETGESRISKSTSPNGERKRVRGLFVPEGKNNKRAPLE
tara:strand:- start:13 stop:516 length:504 start_codon:yes stop_codon:yes gene_type:complete